MVVPGTKGTEKGMPCPRCRLENWNVYCSRDVVVSSVNGKAVGKLGRREERLMTKRRELD